MTATIAPCVGSASRDKSASASSLDIGPPARCCSVNGKTGAVARCHLS